MIVSIITVFWNAAIIASAYERLTAGTNPSFSYGIGQAMKCLPKYSWVNSWYRWALYSDLRRFSK